ncbi:MAG: CoA transferase [Hyphomonadaceae bacterium]|nr:CoA transferase [Hyphomonadaceae bacterium]
MARPLEGIRIADFSHVMAGPFASHFLALMGADVVKIEAPGIGDPMRNYGADRRYDGMAPAFIAANCGKRSIVLDLKQPGALDVAKRLIRSSDVVLENFRPGVMERLGLGYEACRALRADIIFCSVSGYGQSGPMRDYPAIDNIVQATSGMMSVNGDPDGPFMRIGFPAVDTYTGTLAAMSILGALLRRAQCGEGQRIDVAMLDAAMVLTATAIVPHLVTGQALPRTGNVGFSGQPTAGVFTAKDGASISLGVVQPVQFERLCDVLRRKDLLTHPDFQTPDLRRRNAAALCAVLAPEFAKRDGAEWERTLSEAGAPCGLVRTIAEAVAMPNLGERGVVTPLHIAGLAEKEDVAAIGAGWTTSSDGPRIDGPPPRLGEHSRTVLRELGYGDAEADALINAGAVREGGR